MSSQRSFRAIALVSAIAIVCLVVLQAAQAAPVWGAPLMLQDRMGSVCYHTDPSDWTCPDSTGFTRTSGIASASMTITYRDGKTKTVQLPAETDAVFLSSNSVRNFLLRYYQATNLKKARALKAYLAKHSTY